MEVESTGEIFKYVYALEFDFLLAQSYQEKNAKFKTDFVNRQYYKRLVE